jgi:hypothetical protein
MYCWHREKKENKMIKEKNSKKKTLTKKHLLYQKKRTKSAFFEKDKECIRIVWKKAREK